MALDARHRSSIYGKLVPVLGEEDANVLMSEFPSVEADELVTRQYLRAELAELRSEFRGDLAAVRSEIADLRNDLTLRMIAIIGTATAVIGALNALG